MEEKISFEQKCLFVTMLAACIARGATAFLRSKSPQEKRQLVEAWDLYQHTPIGVIFNRPDFENLNVRNNDIRKNNTERFTEHSVRRNARV